MNTYQHVKTFYKVETKSHSNWLHRTMVLLKKQLRHLNIMYVSHRLPDAPSKTLKVQWHWEGDWICDQLTKVFDHEK